MDVWEIPPKRPASDLTGLLIDVLSCKSLEVPVHNIQQKVPVENVEAMLEAAYNCGLRNPKSEIGRG